MGRPILAFYITLCCVAFIISKIVVSLLLYKRWLRKQRIVENNVSGGKMVMFQSPTTAQCLTSKSFMRMVSKLTDKDIIGSGGYGIVYRLVIDDNTTFAVKKLSKGSTSRDSGFERELKAMGDIKHRNIVSLHGYCIAAHFNLLIYELMPNGSLDTLLHKKVTKDKALDWPTRYKIAVGTARGISYLHHDCIPHIIHRDIKSSNILLDLNMEARVSDFGLATLMRSDQSHVSTAVAGTFGYLAPEYFDTGRATTKGDVYSFGVVLLELLTGKRPMDESFVEETKLVSWVKEVVKLKREEQAIDSGLVCYPVEEVKKTFSIAEKCLQFDPFSASDFNLNVSQFGAPSTASPSHLLTRLLPDHTQHLHTKDGGSLSGDKRRWKSWHLSERNKGGEIGRRRGKLHAVPCVPWKINVYMFLSQTHQEGNPSSHPFARDSNSLQ